MTIEIDLDLSPEDERELASILKCDPMNLGNALSGYCSAAAKEYVSMFLGKKVFTRGSDISEYRLSLLVESAFDGAIPSEQDVCRLFQLTENRASALIRAMMSKYQYQLRDSISQSLRALVRSAEYNQEDENFEISVHSKNLIDELNRILAEIDTSLPPVQRKRGSIATYVISTSSYLRLCERFDLEPAARSGSNG